MNQSKKKMECIFCNLPINFLDLSSKAKLKDQKVYKCVNGHLIHHDCLKKRLLIAQTCQICGEPYSSEIIQVLDIKPIKVPLNSAASNKISSNLVSTSASNTENRNEIQMLEKIQENIGELGKQLVEIKQQEKKLNKDLTIIKKRKTTLEHELQTLNGKEIALRMQLEQIHKQIKAVNKQINEYEHIIPTLTTSTGKSSQQLISKRKVAEQSKNIVSSSDQSKLYSDVDNDIKKFEKKRKKVRTKLMGPGMDESINKRANTMRSSLNFASSIAEQVNQKGLNNELFSTNSLNNHKSASEADVFDPGLDDDFDPLNFAETVTRRAKRKQHETNKKEHIPFQDITAKTAKEIPGKIIRPSFIDTADIASEIQKPTPKKQTSLKSVRTSSQILKNRSKTQSKFIAPEKKLMKPRPKVASLKSLHPISSTEVSKSTSSKIPKPSQSFSSSKSSSSLTSQKSISQAKSDKKGPLCVICHAPIIEQDLGESENNFDDELINCPNDHPVHRGCLKMWIVHSNLCPLCHEQYSEEVVASFDSFKKEFEDQKQTEKEQAERERLKREREELLKEINPEFTKKYNEADKLMKVKEFNKALKIFWEIIDNEYFPLKDQRMLRTTLNIGLIYYKQGKHAQAIKQFMKIVKIDFNYPLAFYFLGLCYDQMGFADKTKWAFERALKNTQALAVDNPKYSKFVKDIEHRLQRLPI
ncbi:hypothetical protein [Candidatus Harpocratesius sp.]